MKIFGLLVYCCLLLFKWLKGDDDDEWTDGRRYQLERRWMGRGVYYEHDMESKDYC